MLPESFVKYLDPLLFPVKLFLLAQSDQCKSVYWSQCGDGVKLNLDILSEECFTPGIFNVSDHKHVFRQLSYYGYKRVDKTGKVVEFKHPDFKEQNLELAQTIRRASKRKAPKKELEEILPFVERRKSSRLKINRDDGSIKVEFERELLLHDLEEVECTKTRNKRARRKQNYARKRRSKNSINVSTTPKVEDKIEVQEDETEIQGIKIDFEGDNLYIQEDKIEIQQEKIEIQEEAIEIQEEKIEIQEETIETQEEKIIIQEETIEFQEEKIVIQEEKIDIEEENFDILEKKPCIQPMQKNNRRGRKRKIVKIEFDDPDYEPRYRTRSYVARQKLRNADYDLLADSTLFQIPSYAPKCNSRKIEVGTQADSAIDHIPKSKSGKDFHRLVQALKPPKGSIPNRTSWTITELMKDTTWSPTHQKSLPATLEDPSHHAAAKSPKDLDTSTLFHKPSKSFQSPGLPLLSEKPNLLYCSPDPRVTDMLSPRFCKPNVPELIESPFYEKIPEVGPIDYVQILSDIEDMKDNPAGNLFGKTFDIADLNTSKKPCLIEDYEDNYHADVENCIRNKYFGWAPVSRTDNIQPIETSVKVENCSNNWEAYGFSSEAKWISNGHFENTVSKKHSSVMETDTHETSPAANISSFLCGINPSISTQNQLDKNNVTRNNSPIIGVAKLFTLTMQEPAESEVFSTAAAEQTSTFSDMPSYDFNSQGISPTEISQPNLHELSPSSMLKRPESFVDNSASIDIGQSPIDMKQGLAETERNFNCNPRHRTFSERPSYDISKTPMPTTSTQPSLLDIHTSACLLKRTSSVNDKLPTTNWGKSVFQEDPSFSKIDISSTDEQVLELFKPKLPTNRIKKGNTKNLPNILRRATLHDHRYSKTKAKTTLAISRNCKGTPKQHQGNQQPAAFADPLILAFTDPNDEITLVSSPLNCNGTPKQHCGNRQSASDADSLFFASTDSNDVKALVSSPLNCDGTPKQHHGNRQSASDADSLFLASTDSNNVKALVSSPLNCNGTLKQHHGNRQSAALTDPLIFASTHSNDVKALDASPSAYRVLEGSNVTGIEYISLFSHHQQNFAAPLNGSDQCLQVNASNEVRSFVLDSTDLTKNTDPDGQLYSYYLNEDCFISKNVHDNTPLTRSGVENRAAFNDTSVGNDARYAAIFGQDLVTESIPGQEPATAIGRNDQQSSNDTSWGNGVPQYTNISERSKIYLATQTIPDYSPVNENGEKNQAVRSETSKTTFPLLAQCPGSLLTSSEDFNSSNFEFRNQTSFSDFFNGNSCHDSGTKDYYRTLPERYAINPYQMQKDGEIYSQEWLVAYIDDKNTVDPRYNDLAGDQP